MDHLTKGFRQMGVPLLIISLAAAILISAFVVLRVKP